MFNIKSAKILILKYCKHNYLNRNVFFFFNGLGSVVNAHSELINSEI
jgi:hypothetical protein